jgi:hypothetical protein
MNLKKHNWSKMLLLLKLWYLMFTHSSTINLDQNWQKNVTPTKKNLITIKLKRWGNMQHTQVFFLLRKVGMLDFCYCYYDTMKFWYVLTFAFKPPHSKQISKWWLNYWFSTLLTTLLLLVLTNLFLQILTRFCYANH